MASRIDDDGINEYFDGLREIVDRCRVRGDEPSLDHLDQLVKSSDPLLQRLIQERVAVLSAADRSRVLPFISSGYFDDLRETERIAAFALSTELQLEFASIQIDRRFEAYQSNQPLLTAFPELERKRRDDLMSAEVIKRLRRSGAFLYRNRYLRVDPYLIPATVEWTQSSFPEKHLYLRIDPYFVSDVQPSDDIVEAVLVPANPNWWQGLNLHRYEKGSAAYQLDRPEQIAADLQVTSEYYVDGVRRLEAHAKRGKINYLSMMVEELAEPNGSTNEIVGRCIHWDTTAVAGTDVTEAHMQHLDLAINVYRGSAASQRMDQSLATNGRVVDATVRTHLLRIEDVPAKALLGYAVLFLRSRCLLSQWVTDQFPSESLPEIPEA